MSRFAHRWRQVVRLATRHARPRWRLGAAIVAGAVVGASPFFGFHLLMCVLAARALRLNVLAMYAAANISIPPLVPLLGFASVQAGHRLLHGEWLSLTRDTFRAQPVARLVAQFFVDWMVGGVVVGLAAGAVMALLVSRMAAARDARRDEERARRPSVGALRRRYAAAEPSVRWHAVGKFLLDPVNAAVPRLLRRGGRVVDLGAGVGLMATLLGLRGTSVTAVEHDEAKVRVARDATAGLPVEVVEGDVRTCEIPPSDATLLVDVLHYHDDAEVASLLARASAALRPGGLLVIRDHDGARGGGAAWTRLVERWSVRNGWNRASGTKFFAVSQVVDRLRALGLRPRSLDVSWCFLPGNVLVVARKPLAAAVGAA